MLYDWNILYSTVISSFWEFLYEWIVEFFTQKWILTYTIGYDIKFLSSFVARGNLLWYNHTQSIKHLPSICIYLLLFSQISYFSQHQTISFDEYVTGCYDIYFYEWVLKNIIPLFLELEKHFIKLKNTWDLFLIVNSYSI